MSRPNSLFMLGLLGHRSGKRTGGTGITHRVGLLLAALATALTGWLFIATDAVVSARASRIVEREPVMLAPDAPIAAAVARYMVRADFYQDRQFLLIYLEPLKPDTAPPPGLPRWPDPGEAFLSPALVSADDDGVLRSRYGSMAGEIGLEGLADPDEQLVYLRSPLPGALERFDGPTLISGFGFRLAGDDWYRTDWDTGRSASELYWLLLFVMVVPLTALVAVAVRSGAEVRDRRLAMLDALGAPRAAIAWVLIGEALAPVALGALVATACAAATTLIDLRLPIAGYGVLASDLASRRVWIPGLAASVIVALPGLIVLSHLRRRRLRGTRPRAVSTRLQAWPRVLFLLAVAVGIWSATTAYSQGGVDLDSSQTTVFIITVMIALATMPSAIAGVASPFGRLVASAGRRAGWASALVAGRWLTSRSAALSRMCAALVVGIGVLTLIQVWVSQATLAGEVTPVRVLTGDQLVTVRGVRADLDADRFVAALGTDRVLRVESTNEDRQIIVGTCQALASIGHVRHCSQTPVSAEQAFGQLTAIGKALKSTGGSIMISSEPLISTAPNPDNRLAGFLVHNTGGSAGFDAIAKTAYTMLAAPDVHTAGQYDISGSLDYADLFTWLWAFGVFGIALLVTTTTLSAIDVFLTQARSLGVIGGMHAGRGLYYKIAGWNIAGPLALAAVGGGATAALLGFLLTRLRLSGSLSWDFLAAAVLAVAGIGAALALLCGEAATRSLRNWRPAAD